MPEIPGVDTLLKKTGECYRYLLHRDYKQFVKHHLKQTD